MARLHVSADQRSPIVRTHASTWDGDSSLSRTAPRNGRICRRTAIVSRSAVDTRWAEAHAESRCSSHSPIEDCPRVRIHPRTASNSSSLHCLPNPCLVLTIEHSRPLAPGSIAKVSLPPTKPQVLWRICGKNAAKPRWLMDRVRDGSLLRDEVKPDDAHDNDGADEGELAPQRHSREVPERGLLLLFVIHRVSVATSSSQGT